MFTDVVGGMFTLDMTWRVSRVFGAKPALNFLTNGRLEQSTTYHFPLQVKLLFELLYQVRRRVEASDVYLRLS